LVCYDKNYQFRKALHVLSVCRKPRRYFHSTAHIREECDRGLGKSKGENVGFCRLLKDVPTDFICMRVD